MERIKHHFCWVKTVAGPHKAAPVATGVGAADLSVAWSPETGLAQTVSTAEGLMLGTVTPQHAGVPPAKPKGKAAASPNGASATATAQPEHSGQSPATDESTAGEAGGTGQAEFMHAGVPPASPAVASSLKSLVPPPPPVVDPTVGAKHGPVPPANKRMVFAGATMAGAWAFDDLRLVGVPDGASLRHEFQVIIGDQSAAHAWLASPEGREWLLNAKAVSLITFAVMGIY